MPAFREPNCLKKVILFMIFTVLVGSGVTWYIYINSELLWAALAAPAYILILFILIDRYGDFFFGDSSDQPDDDTIIEVKKSHVPRPFM
jgi:hypothetical protein